MKIKITEVRSQKPEARSRQVSAFRFPLSAFPRAERGLALVITLILLSVTLVMAIAFLAVSRRERVSVTTSTEITTARLAADSALAAAQAQILANIFSTGAALHNYHLLVSTNYINGFGYTPGSANPTNVNWDYFAPNFSTANWTPDDFNQNVANLLFLPRAPVLVSGGETNGRFFLDLNRNGVFDDTGNLLSTVDSAGVTNFIAANQAPFPAVGDPQWVGILERPGTPHAADNKFLSRYAFIVLPIGESLDINAIHNEAITRTVQAFPNQSGVTEGFLRNQGVGSWEINLAAFFADLNTNQWDNPLAQPYQYFEPIAANRGFAFEDALAFLGYRYNYNYANLSTAGFVFGSAAASLQLNNIDEYADGPLQTGTPNIDEALAPDSINAPWAGANNLNRYFTSSDFYDPTKNSVGFNNRLLGASSAVTPNGARPTYDRYTYYRMLDQLGTDSAPADDRMNLNYSNAVVRYDANGAFLSATVIPGAETNLVSWTPINFFSAAADALLKTYTTNWFHKNPSNFLATYYRITGAAANYYHQDGFGNVITNDPTGFGLTNIPYFGMTNELPAFGLGNIPVLVSNTFVYSPSINRLLQLAANIYDASTNNFYPHVFRPIFYHDSVASNVFIVGFEEIQSVVGINDTQLSQPIDISVLLSQPSGYSSGATAVNIFGVPWIIGAKKYLPNFNTFYSYNSMQVVRKIQVSRTKNEPWNINTSADFRTNQMIVMGLTNHIGFGFWNSYATNYPGLSPVIYARDYIRMSLSYGSYNYSYFTNYVFLKNQNPWLGSGWGQGNNYNKAPANQEPNPDSFVSTNLDFGFIPMLALLFDQAGNFIGFSPEQWNSSVTSLPPFPSFQLATTNWFQGFIIDNGHVIDYVELSGPTTIRNLGDELKDPDFLAGNQTSLMWSTNNSKSGLNWGVQNQITVSQLDKNVPQGGKWNPPENYPASLAVIPEDEAGFFYAFFTGGKYKGLPNTNLIQQAPYTPVRTVTSPTIWTVNDPLVHYLSSDLNAPLTGLTNTVWRDDDPYHSTLPKPNLAGIPGGTPIPQRYQPWGTGGQMDEIAGDNRFNFYLGFKDPLVTGSDDWDFPTSRYPSAGWLGRVHRGTPWQTVFLKATNVVEYIDSAKLNPNLGKEAWLAWLGDTDEFDGVNSRPIQDALLFDVFTAVPHPNATRGALSVNQTHLAAWSALLSGMMAITNYTDVPSFDAPPLLTNVVVDPAGLNVVDSPLWLIVNGPNGINQTRVNKNIFSDGAFTRIGDILRAPALTEQSPFINRSGTAFPFGDQRLNKDISDEQYEWLPQQMLGLLRASSTPRYVVYAYGQTLKPAPGGTVLSSSALPGGYNPFGLITNYQVVAESATRAVISIQPVVTNSVFGPVTNYVPRVESFNVLPPE